LLAEVTRACPGVTEALLVDEQGMLVERFQPAAAADPEELAVEILAAAPALGRVAAAARIACPVEWLIVGEQGTIVVRRLANLGWCLAVRVPAGEWIGRARFAARVAAGRLAQALGR
jgi:predicted regulator of Ras-like GTPase activity (Roadblock/LC7/MglB family)